MNILILGGYGQTGKPLTRHLLRQTQHKLLIAGRHLDKAQSFCSSLSDGRVSPLQVDARDPASLREALRGVDFLLVASPTTANTEVVVNTALGAGVDYLDVQLSDEKLRILQSHEQEINDKGLCFITEAGLHPGLPACMVRYAATKLDAIETSLSALYMSLHGEVEYTEAVDELVDLFQHYQGQVYTKGVWTKSGSYSSRRFDFGEDIGKRPCYSMFLEELRALPGMLPSLKETGLYVSSTGWLVDAVTMLLMFGLWITPRRLRKSLGRAIWWTMTNLSPKPYGFLLQTEATGRSSGQPASLRLRLAHEDGYEFTAIPVVALLMQYNAIRKPGLHMMGHLCNPERLVADMGSMGVKVSEVVRQGSDFGGEGGAS
jgi:hypothetical protein